MCVLLITRLLRLAGSWALVNRFNHTSVVTVVTATDCPYSVHNRCVIEVLVRFFCVITLLFGFFCGYRGICVGTESDLFLFPSDHCTCKIHKLFSMSSTSITFLQEKGRDLTQSYDKSPYTNRNVKRAKWQQKQRHKIVRLNSGCGPT